MQEGFCKLWKDQTENVIGVGVCMFFAFLTFSVLQRFSIVSTYYFDNKNNRTTAGIKKHKKDLSLRAEIKE